MLFDSEAMGRITPEMLAKPGTEHAEQSALFCWANDNRSWSPELMLLFAIPNGGLRDKVTASRLKASGVKSGVPDICLPVQRGDYAGLYIELKRLKEGRASDEQNDWIGRLKLQGYAATVCRGWIEASQVISSYLLLPPRFVIVQANKR